MQLSNFSIYHQAAQSNKVDKGIRHEPLQHLENVQAIVKDYFHYRMNICTMWVGNSLQSSVPNRKSTLTVIRKISGFQRALTA